MTRLQFERRKRGWSLQTLGFHAGVQAPELSKMERFILKPYPRQVARLAEVLGVKPEELLEDVYVTEPPPVGVSI